MDNQHIGYVIGFTPYQYYMSQIVIIVSGMVYALVLMSIALFRPWVVTKTTKNLLIATSVAFISGACTRLALILINSKSNNILLFLNATQMLLAAICSYCAITSWMKLDQIFSIRSPEDAAHRMLSSIKEDIKYMDEITLEHVCEIIDEHEKDIRRWVYDK